MQVKTRFLQFWYNHDLRTRKVNRNIAYSAVIKGLGVFISLMIIPLTLGYLSVYEYGIWVTLNSILTWINYFDIGLGNGLRNKLTEALAEENKAKAKIYVSTTFSILSAIALVLCIIVIIVNNYVDWRDILNVANDCSSNLNQVVSIVFICLCITFVIRTVGTVYLAYQDTWINDLLTLLGSVLSFVWIFVLTKTSLASLMQVALAFSVAPIIVYLIALPVTFKIIHKDICPSFKDIQFKYASSLVGLGIQFFLLQLAVLIIFATSNVIISRLFSPTEVTPYNIAYKYYNILLMGFNIIIAPIWSSITDAVTRNNYMWVKNTMTKLIKTWCCCVIIGIIMILASQLVFKLWIGTEVNVPYSLCTAMAFYMVVYLWTLLFSTYCNGTSHLRIALWTMLSAAAIFIPLAIVMGRHLGPIGIPYAMGIVLLVPAIGLYVQYRLDLGKIKNEDALSTPQM